jgi:hypothetical protein
VSRWLACLVVLAGCDALFNLDHLKDRTDAGLSGDANDAGEVDGPLGSDGSQTIGRFIPMSPAFATSYSFDTDELINTNNDGRCNVLAQASPNPAICVIAADSILISARITSKGSRALAFAALSSLNVESTGVIDVSSARGTPLGRTGPAANEPASFGCTPAAGAQQMALGGGGGGAAGSFKGTGGGGGLSDSDTPANSNLALLSPPTTLRGGCAGAGGGHSADDVSFSTGGDSGGALYLLAGTSIRIDGQVLANGAGGGRAGSNIEPEQNAGGGGGGSGGMIVLDAPLVVAPGLVVAQGGGGGGGGDGTAIAVDGKEWNQQFPMAAASGGTGGGDASAGGDGSSASSISGREGVNCNQIDGGGGGGGGGGAGWIRTYGTLSQASQFYPAPNSVP